MPLPQGRQKQLEGIIESMQEQGASNSEIRTIIQDFRSKYEEERGVTEKVGGFVGLEPLGKGIGLAGREFAGGNEALRAAADRESEISASVPPETIARLQREGKPLPGQTGLEATPQLQNITTEDITNRQVLGSAATAAGTIATAGLASPASTAGRVAVGAGTGGALGTTSALAQGASDTGAIKAGVAGATLGGAIPGAAPILRKTGSQLAQMFGQRAGVTGEAVERVAAAGRQGGSRGAASKAALSGQDDARSILKDARDGLTAIKEHARKTYETQLKKISERGQQFNRQKFVQNSDDVLDEAGLKYKDPDGGDFTVDLSESNVGVSSHKKYIEQTLDEIGEMDISDVTDPLAWDRLKQRINDRIAAVEPHTKAGAFLSKLNNRLTRELKEQITGYEEMTAGYANAQELVNDISTSLSLTSKIKPETAAKKLLTALKSNNEFRQQTILRLEEEGGKELLDRVAAVALSGAAKGGLTSSLLRGSSLGLGGVVGALAGVPAGLLVSIANAISFNPRVIGEAARIAGKASGVASKVAPPEKVRRLAPAAAGVVSGTTARPDPPTTGFEGFIE